MVCTLYVARHGLRANEAPPPTGIDGDVRLTEEGIDQARELGAHLNTVKPPIDEVYSSPFWRCLETATPFARLSGSPIRVDPGLGEYYHVDRPTHPVPASPTITAQTFEKIDLEYVPMGLKPPATGETHETLKERVSEVLDGIFKRSSADSILLVTHAAVKIAIGEVLVDQAPRAGTASLDRYDMVDDKWQRSLNGDVSFLSGGEQMHWSFDMAYEAGSAADVASRQQTAPAPETVKVLVPLDLSQTHGKVTGSKVELQLADLEKPQPVAKIGNEMFLGQWQEIVGTEVYTTPQGRPIGSAKYRIALTPVVQEKKGSGRLVDRLEAVEQRRNNES